MLRSIVCSLGSLALRCVRCAGAVKTTNPVTCDGGLHSGSAVEVTDALVTDRVINELMGKDASARFRFIMDHAEDASELDV